MSLAHGGRKQALLPIGGAALGANGPPTGGPEREGAGAP